MSYVFFNTRVMTRKEHHASTEAQEKWESFMAAQDVLTPMAVALLTMAFSLGVMAWALREKERLRLRLLASGAVWTAHEGIARRMFPDREAAQQQVDEMSEEQVALLVQQRMAEKAKPQVLLRVGTTLYRCLPNSSSAATVQQLAGRGPTGNASSPGSSQGGALEQQQGQGGQQQGQQGQGGEPGEGEGTQQAGQPGGLQRLPEGHAQLQPPGQQCVQGQQQGQQGPADQQGARLSPQACEGQEEGPIRAGQGQAHLATSTNLPLLHGGQSSTCQLPPPQQQPDIPMPPSSPTATQPLLPAVGAAPSLPDRQSLSAHSPAPLRSLSQSAQASTPSQAQALNWLLAGPHPPHHPSPSLLNSNQGAPLPWGSSLVSGAEPQTVALGARPQCLERGPGSMRAAMGMGAGGLGVGGVTQGLATSTLTGLFDGRLLGLSTPNQVVPEEGVDDGLCVICYDKPSSCVFLDCGHGGFCKACAYRIFVRPPNECPTCRQHIEQVVELEEVRPMGQVSKVRQ
ncbi:hypothetical protein QJQ45_008162 [Haematococcus lacustris]|nr:hypothetical protein QJQ45_008162 [Haematococcus lacustris]